MTNYGINYGTVIDNTIVVDSLVIHSYQSYGIRAVHVDLIGDIFLQN